MDVNIENVINQIPEESTRAAIRTVVEMVRAQKEETNKQLAEVWDFISAIDVRLRHQERYLSKDSIIIDNPPFDARNLDSFLKELLVFLNRLYKKDDVQITESRLKAFHILPGPGPLLNNLMPSIIVKSVHFNDKIEIYKNRRMLKTLKNDLNGKNIWMKERLPPLHMFTKKLAENKNLITVTNNCQVSVLCKGTNGNNKYVKVNDAIDLEKLQNPVMANRDRTGANAIALKNTQKRMHREIFTDEERVLRLYASLSPEQKKNNGRKIGC